MTIDTPDWVGKSVFYQIFPDRFARGSQTQTEIEWEPWDSAPTLHGFKGGDLYGVAEKLDHLQNLGITAIYFCPIFSSAANHRYHTYDYMQVDPLLGGNAALRQLIDEAHDRNMKIVLDGVFNHASRGFWQFHHVLENGEASPYRNWFHMDSACMKGDRPFQPYPNLEAQQALESGQGSLEAIGYSAWWNLPALPKFNTNCEAVRNYLWDVATYWIEFGIDGWRLDVPNEIDDDEFWREFRRRVRAINPEAYVVGEVWGEAKRWLQGDMWDAVMNYQITAACLGYFGAHHLDLKETRRPSSFSHVQLLQGAEFAAEVERVTTMYSPEIAACQLNLLDSHDMPRFLTCCQGNTSSLKLAWLFLCCLPGAPCVYYGDEVGLDGRHDPDCRKGFPWNQADWQQDIFHWYQQCIQIRTGRELGQHSRPKLLAESSAATAFQVQSNDGPHLLVLNPGSETVLLSVSCASIADEALISLGSIQKDDHGDGLLQFQIEGGSGAIWKSSGSAANVQ